MPSVIRRLARVIVKLGVIALVGYGVAVLIKRITPPVN